MSEYMKLSPSRMAVAGEDDVFITQLMNDNIKKAGQQLPCCARFPVSGIVRPGYPVGIVSVNPPTVGHGGPFVGIVTAYYPRKNAAVLQLCGLASVVVHGSVEKGALIGVSSAGEAVVTQVSALGSDNFIGCVTEAGAAAGGTTVCAVLLRSWVGNTGSAYRKDRILAGGLCAEHRGAGSAHIAGGILTVNGLRSSGVAIVHTTGEPASATAVRFRFRQNVHNVVVQPRTKDFSVTVDSAGEWLQVEGRAGGLPENAQMNFLCSVGGV